MDEANDIQGKSQKETETEDGYVQEENRDIDFILDIPLNVSVELGRVKMFVKDLLQLGQGSIIELNKSSEEPLEIYVNNKLIAKGEVVVADERFGIRVTDVISKVESGKG
ncbi:MAG: flagellar motor switch protein FliN [Thermodesulfobacteriota bacterium]